MIKPIAAALLALPLCACSSGPSAPARSARNFHESPPPHSRAAADGNPERHRAPKGAAPQRAPNGTVSLRDMLEYADVNSPVLATARSSRSRAAAEREAAAVLLPSNPELSVAAGVRKGNAGSDIELDVSLMQQFRIGGERGRRMTAADKFRELTESEIEQIRWLVHCDVHATFHQALIEQERAALAGRVVKFQEEVLRVVERQIAAGETAALTLRLAQAEVAQARQALVAAEQGSLSSRIRLAQLSGWPVAFPPLPAGGVDIPREPPPIERLNAVARERLPSLRTAQARIREAEARVSVADREAWLKPSLGVQYQREGNVSGEGATNIFMGVVSLPIPSFQRNQGDRARSRADVVVAEAELDQTRRLLDGQIAEARSEVVAAAARAKAYGTEILPRFEENLALLRRSFELGEIDILALSTGRERFLRIQSDALLAQHDYFVALAGLERVVGVDLWHDDHEEGGSK